MGLRIVQVCGLWFWVAAIFFIFVVVNQYHTLQGITTALPASASQVQVQATSAAGLTTRDRLARAELAWKSSVALRHKMALEHPQHPKIPFFPAQQLSDFGKYPYTVWDFFPATYTCPHDIQRVGRLGDGGKWVCGMSLFEARKTPETIIYSFGVNDESTFEAEMLARIPNAHIYAYDYSVTKFGPQLPEAYLSRAHFKQVGLGDKDELSRQPQFFTLKSLMDQNGHKYMDILKIDIEGSEYAAFDAFMDSFEAAGASTLPIGQVMIELHLMDDQNVNFERFLKWWERLESFGMRPTWLEVNLLAVTLGEGKTNPRCVEYVWINSKDEKNILLQEA